MTSRTPLPYQDLADRDGAADGFDWSATPLGPMGGWSAELRMAVERATRTPAAIDTAAPMPAAELTPAVILDALFDTASIGLGVLDRDLRLVRVNASLAEMNGVSQEEHIGKRPIDVVPGIPELEALMEGLRSILVTGEPLRNVELRGVTPASPDAQRIWIEEFFPVRAGDSIAGVVGTVTEVTESRRFEEALRASEALFRQFAIASSDILWVRNIVTQDFEFMSPAVAKLFRGSASIPMGDIRTFDWMAAILPEDREAAVTTMAQVRQGQSVVVNYRVRLPASGKIRWLRNTAFPLRDPDGAIRRIGGIVHDVTDEHDVAQRLGVLVGELQHRTRNLMGVVQAMAETTLASSTDMDGFAATFTARIDTLARVQSLLSQHEGQERIAFDELLRYELGAIGALPEQDSRVTLDGPERVALRSGMIQTLALAIHELMTNSLKHGVLGQPAARLHIRWWLTPAAEADHRLLHIDWRETGVAMATTGRIGQGRELIEHALPYQLNADTRFTLTDEGVHCTIMLPVPDVADQAIPS